MKSAQEEAVRALANRPWIQGPTLKCLHCGDPVPSDVDSAYCRQREECREVDNREVSVRLGFQELTDVSDLTGAEP